MTVIATAAAALAPVSVAKATGTFDEHTNLYNTIQSVCVRVQINPPQHCKGVDGLYMSHQRLLVICQDYVKDTPANQEVDWTANDLDTLRHEAHHLLQDCALGRLGDGQLATWHRTPALTYQFIAESIGERQARDFMDQPAYEGHNEQRQLIEMEAFATAAVISPNEIASAILKVCR